MAKRNLSISNMLRNDIRKGYFVHIVSQVEPLNQRYEMPELPNRNEYILVSFLKLTHISLCASFAPNSTASILYRNKESF